MEVGKFHIKVYTFGVKFYVFMHHCCMTKLAGEARLWNPRETKVQTPPKSNLVNKEVLLEYLTQNPLKHV